MAGSDTSATCPGCGAANAPYSAFCENCGSKLLLEDAGGPRAPAPAGTPFLGGHGRALAAAAAVVGVAAVLIGGVLIATRGDDGDEQPLVVDTFVDTTDDIEPEVTETEEVDASFPTTDAEIDLYGHIPVDIDDSCETDVTMPDSALAGALCVVADQDILVQYWLFDDGETMDQAYGDSIYGDTHVTNGSCPDDPPDESTWVDGDDVTRGSLACYTSILDGLDDAHVIWTDDDLLILGVVSHVGTDAETESLMDFWKIAGPE